MTTASPILPALGGFDMSSRPTCLNDTQDLTKAILAPSSPAEAKTSLPPFASLATTAREHNPSSHPGSPISPCSASSGDNSRDSSNSSMEANSSFNSDEGAGEAMDTREQPSSPSPTAESLRGVPPPTWTNRWTSRAPPPKPLVRSALGGRRHHPYAPSSSSSRGAATPSPTWPAHIGIDDASARHGISGGNHNVEAHPPHTAGFFDAVPSPQFRQPTRPARLRSTTVLLPPPHGEVAQDGHPHQRPGGPSRHNSFGGAQDADRTGSVASSAYALGHRRSRGDSFATTDSSHSYPSTHPSSPLLFAPLSPNEPFAPPYGLPPPTQQQQHPKGPAGHMPRFAYGPPGSQSPHVGVERLHMGYEESPKGGPLYLSPYDRYDHARRMQAPQLPSPAAPGPVLQHGKVEQWRGVVAPSQADAPIAATPALERASHSRRRRRPPYSYSSLIAQAISSSPQGRMTLREIYTWISNAYPELYSMDGADSQGWQNTVRHNLSLNKSFVKVARTAQDIYEGCSSSNPAHSQAARGKGGWWTIDPVVAQAQLGANFRGTGGETSPTEAHGRPRYRESSPEGYSDGEYFPSPGNTPGYGMDPSWPRPVAGTADQHRRGSADGASGSVASGVPAYPANYPSVLMRPRPRPSSLDQGAMLGYDQRPPSFRRSRGYSNSELVQERGGPSRAMYGVASSPPSGAFPRPPLPHTLAPIGQPDKVQQQLGSGRLLEVPTRDAEMSDRDLTPKAAEGAQGERETATPQAGEGERSGRMAISDMLC